jgi:cellulose synthase/poly-beta-1,6-N-acetylglucosamine synthase-like glycosyltransferase
MNQSIIWMATYLFLAVCFIQCLYYFIFLVGFHKSKKPVKASGTLPGVSVVVCAHDEEENLRKLLPALYAQDHPNYEIIIVNDRSNDGTYDLLLEESQSNDKLKPVQVSQTPDHVNGKKYGLTLGIKAAKYDIILLTDADCLPASNSWVSLMAEGYHADTQVVIGYSAYNREKSFLNAFIRFETLTTAIQYLSLALLGRPYMGVGRNLSYKKSLFLNNKGFNSHLKVMGGDDDLFVNQLATGATTRVVTLQKATTLSVPKKNWGAWFRQKKRHISVSKYYKAGDKLVLGLFSFTTVLFWAGLIGLALVGVEPTLLAGGYLLRWLFLTSALYTAGKRMEGGFHHGAWMIMDLVYPFYLIFVGIPAAFSKNIKWS